MTNQVQQILAGFEQTRVLVVGDVMLDEYLFGDADRVSPESPVLVVREQRREFRPGGAANTATNVASLGADVSLVGQIGRSDDQVRLEELAGGNNVTCHFVRNLAISTTQKTRVIANDHQVLRIDREDISAPPWNEVEEVLRGLNSQSFDLILVSDYAKGFVGQETVQYLKSLGMPIVADIKPINKQFFHGVFAVCPNLKEAQQMSGCSDVVEAGKQLVHELETNVIITRSHEGVSVFDKAGQHCYLPVTAAEVRDVSGAGDTFVAAFGLAVACQASLQDAAIIANHAAGSVVQKFGTAMLNLSELRKSFETTSVKRVSREELVQIRANKRRLGKKVVLASGCFDIVHRGHLLLLRKAKSFGDVLIVGLNTDESVKRYKGPDRPVMNEEDRAEVMAALDFVDHVTFFDEDDPSTLLAELQPDVFVKGRDYDQYDYESLPESRVVDSYGGEIKIVTGHITSTTEIVERIRK